MSKGQRDGFLGRVRRHYECVTLKKCRMEVTGGGRVIVQGCEEILEYGRERIRLSVCDPDLVCVVVDGHELTCISYHPDAVVIEGAVCSVCLCRAEGQA